MIKRIVRGRSNYDDRALKFCPDVTQLSRESRITCKVSQVDILFDAIVPPNLRRRND